MAVFKKRCSFTCSRVKRGASRNYSLHASPGGLPPLDTASPSSDTPAHEFALLIAGSFPRAACRQRHAPLGKDAHQAIGGAVWQTPLLTILDILVGQYP